MIHKSRKIETLEQAREVIGALTEKQRHVLRVCYEFLRKNDDWPSSYELKRLIGTGSQNAPYQTLAALERRGVLERNSVNRLRFARVEGMSLGDYLNQGMPQMNACEKEVAE